MDLDTRPVPVYHNSDWHDMGRRSSEAGPSSSRSGRTSISSNSINSRRRSSAAPPMGPPPDIPIPTLPALSEISPISGYSLEEDYQSSAREQDDGYHSSSFPPDPPVFNLNSFQRPTASSQLTAVTQFSQARFAASSVSPHTPVSGNLSDSPPRSLLPRNPSSLSPPQVPSSEVNPDRLHLSPPDTREGVSSSSRPSSRRALTRALELAREAVRLDSTNEDPHGAIQAYSQSVDLLNEVMRRVMRGEDSTEPHWRNGRRRSIVAQEEEVRRLRSIHDTYRDRMNILSLIYSIPPGEQISRPPSRPDSQSSGASRDSQPTIIDDSGRPRRVQAPALNGRSRTSSQQSDSASNTSSPPKMSIPISSDHDSPDTVNGQQATRTSVLTRQRMRSSSNLPPQPPCPSTSPPSTPPVADFQSSPSPPRLSIPTSGGSRSRGNSVSHRRGGSGSRLEALKEETTQSSSKKEQDYHNEQENGIHRTTNRGDSPPLPAVPSPSNSDHSSSVTPRVPTSADQSSIISNGIYSIAANSRIRGGSTVSDTTGAKGRQLLISETTMNGTISLRRDKNKSISSTTILEGTTDGFEGAPTKRMTNSSLPSTTVPTISGRSRASSHPVRPSGPIQGLPLELGTRSAQVIVSNSAAQPPRKSSSVIRQSPQPLSLRTSQLPSAPPSSFSGAALSLVPPPPVLPGHLPTTPTSPLPPIPPSDSLRKPYHLMNLLGHTMTSKSGGYITRKLHVPYDVWSQGGAKLTNLPEKIHVVEVLCDALLAIQEASVEFAGPMGVASGMGLGVGSITRKDGEIWVQKLETFLVVCDNVVSSFGKKLSVGEGFVVKKSTGVGSWGGKLTRRLDKLTNGKNLDSPTMYVQGLQKLFHLSQLLDEHTMAIDSQPMAPVYASLPPDIRSMLELKLRRSSEFFASVVLTFVIRDLSQLLDKYAKKGEKWLAE